MDCFTWSSIVKLNVRQSSIEQAQRVQSATPQ